MINKFGYMDVTGDFDKSSGTEVVWKEILWQLNDLAIWLEESSC